jgi:uncharacterized membrane protein
VVFCFSNPTKLFQTVETTSEMLPDEKLAERPATLPDASRVRAGRVRETFWRSVVKSLSYRLQATITTFLVAWLITREWRLATAIGCGDAVIKMVGFYLHERMWNRISFGRDLGAPDYEI